MKNLETTFIIYLYREYKMFQINRMRGVDDLKDFTDPLLQIE